MTKHWAEQEDMLERYVRGGLGSDERRELESHLNDCPACRSIVRKEIELREGVRSYGRSVLKDRLKARLRQSVSPVVPWPHVMSAAAVLFIVIGLAIINEWWAPEPVLKDSDVAVQERELKSTPPAESRLEQAPDDRPARPVTKEHEADVAQSSETQRKGSGKKDDEPMARAIGETAATGKFATGPPLSVEDAVQPLWLEGFIMQTPGDREETRFRDERRIAPLEVKDEANKKALAKSGPPQKFSVSQQPMANLPKDKQEVDVTRSVMTSMIQSKDSIHLTLFSDRFNRSNQHVQVEAVGEDSLVVTINGTKIGYRVPRGATGKAQ